ncbi:MAG: DUF4266 domain-containing protein [Chitinophagaceae bacterium]|jgi:hypothetical protein|nr:DUF4266 domain-containing protein [Chitinophagaceae bacterium]MCA6446246.1 DUF4266 domain-containing protein [Chitinophagaceae bacterium]
MHKKQKTVLAISCVLAGAMITGCTNVKGYQKSKINDAEMSLSSRRVQRNELNFQGYREGSSGANGGKTGGGCGCN